MRGAVGAGNEWALVVDGVTCNKAFADVAVDNFDQIPVCQLPTPFSVTLKKITAKTLVRPVAIAVRLEEESLAPESVHVVLQQIVYSSERSSQSRQDENEVRALERIALPVHTSRDTIAPSVVLPYPMVAPPQSALSIVSYREVEKWYENVNAISADNEKKRLKYEKARTKHADDYKAWSDKRYEARKSNVTKRTRYFAAQASYVSGGGVGNAPTAPTYKKLPKWIRTAPSPPDYRAPTNGKPQKERHFVIGGKELSSAHVLVDVYKKLTAVCEAVQADPEFEGVSLPAHIKEMRQRLSISKARTELAFLETLLTAFVSPVAAVLLKRRYGINPEGEVVDDVATEELRDQSFEKRMNSTDDVNTSNTSQFVYDYVPFEQRQNTHTRIRMVLEILEHSGERRVIALEPRIYHGMAAHAVYSDFAGDVKALKTASNEFLDCLLSVHKDRGLVAQASDAVADSGLTGWFKWARRKVTGGGEPDGIRPKYEQIEDMINEVRAVHKRIVPVWPEPLPEKLLWEIARQTEEGQTSAAVVAEAARQALESGSDNDFFGTDAEQEQGDDPEAIDLLEAADIGAVVIAGSSALALVRVAPTGSEWTENELQEIRRAEEQAAKEGELNDRIKRIEKLYRKELKDLGVVVGASGEPILPDPSTLVVRELPQVARPLRTPVITLVTPVDTAPPDQNMPVENNSSSLLAKIMAVGLGWVMFVNKYFVHYKYMTAWVKAGLVADIGGVALGGFGALANGVASIALGGLPGFAVAAASGMWAIYNAAQSLGGIGLAFTRDILYYRGESYLVAIPQGVRAAHAILQWSRNSNLEYSKRGTAYWQAMQAARGVPIMSSIAAGRRAFKLIRERAHQADLALRSDSGVTVLYDVSTNTRYSFAEYFLRTATNAKQILALPKVKDVDTWAVVPDTTALFLLPPSDVSECVYEVEQLRRLPYAQAASRTAGSPLANVATSMPALAAKAAFRELFGMVRSGRFPFVTLTGDQLLSTTERIVFSLATSSAKLVEATYGSKAGITLVDGSDSIWTCLPAGVAARLVVRHMSLFMDAESFGGIRSAADFEALQNHWRNPQRVMMDEFAAALVSEAKALASSKDARDAVPDTRLTIEEAVTSFERVRALSTDGDAVGMLVAASAFSAVLRQVGRTHSDGRLAQIVSQVAAAQKGAQTFESQRGLNEPVAVDLPPQRMAAAWASRRIDKDPVKAWRPASSPKGVEDLLEQLGELDVSDGEVKTTTSYYCPIGSRVEGLPGKVPFAVHDLSMRPVWMRAAAAAAHVLMGSIQVTQPASHVTIDARLVHKMGKGPGGLVGFARHPLTMTIGPGAPIVRTQLSAAPKQPEEPSVQAGTVLLAVSELETNPNAGVAVTYRMQRMRSLAYNADRLQNALDLTVNSAQAPETLDVQLPHAEACVALCFGMALLSAEQRAVMHTVQVHIDTTDKRDNAILMLKKVQTNCEAALAQGCKVSTLAEACAALA